MKKRNVSIVSFAVLYIVCLIALCCSQSNLQTFFSSFQTALLQENTFAIHNKKTENVFILQTTKHADSAALYRRCGDGQLLRYSLIGDSILIDETGPDGWLQKQTIQLPTAPSLLFSEISDILKQKSDNTDICKLYANAILTLFFGSDKSMDAYINFSQFPQTMQRLHDFLNDRNNVKQLHIKKDFHLAGITYTLELSNAQNLKKYISEIFAELLCEEIKENFLPSESTNNSVVITITNSIFGIFKELQVKKDGICIFNIRKL